jgi:AraC-like DNA-binding protein
MVEARRLLAEGSTVEEAGRNSGFADVSYFVQRFKRETGTTPKRWARDAADRAAEAIII